MDKYEAKQRYVDKRNAESREKSKNLTEEQINAIETIAHIRHQIHSNIDRYFYDSRELREYIKEIDDIIENSGLPMLVTLIVYELPCADDYDFLDNCDEWEARAEEFNKENPTATLKHTGFSLWIEEGGEYQAFYDELSQLNDRIERWLAKIDEEHGTNYAPTGWARMR